MLSLPRGSSFFRCGLCHQLSYRSRQEHRLSIYENLTRPMRLLAEWEAVQRSRSKRRRRVLMARLLPEVRAVRRDFNRRLREIRSQRVRSGG